MQKTVQIIKGKVLFCSSVLVNMLKKKYGTLWNLMEPYGTLWNLMEPYGTLWNLMEPYGTSKLMIVTLKVSQTRLP